MAAIKTLAAHRPYLTSRAMEALLAVFLTDAQPAKQLLTPRERRVLQLVAEGHSNKRLPRCSVSASRPWRRTGLQSCASLS